MLVSKLSTSLLVCHKEDFDLLLLASDKIKPVLTVADVLIVDIESIPFSLNSILLMKPNMEIQRYLDKFYLWLSIDDMKKKQKLINSLFEAIAEEYNVLIDMQRNKENIDNLLNYLMEYIGTSNGNNVIDYGCGTGLSLLASIDEKIQLIGVDICPHMRKIASASGLKVLGIEELSTQNIVIAGAFASYVFHLLTDTESLHQLWNSIKTGGVIVGNFHKGKNVEFIKKRITEWHGTIKSLQQKTESARHGEYVAFIK